MFCPIQAIIYDIIVRHGCVDDVLNGILCAECGASLSANETTAEKVC